MAERNDADDEARLRALLAEIEAAIAAGHDESGPVELDQTRQGRLSRMNALQRQEMAKAGLRRRGVERARVLAALERVAEGAYGYCTVCGGEIAAKRLEVDPAVPTCIGCTE